MSDSEVFWSRQRLLVVLTVVILAVGAGPAAYRLLRYPREPSPPEHLPGETVDLRSINVNEADAAVLETLPGIGPALAARMVEERRRGGPFRDADDLRRVKGIGPAIAGKIEPYLHFTPGLKEAGGRSATGGH